jgi:hypothetical protein
MMSRPAAFEVSVSQHCARDAGRHCQHSVSQACCDHQYLFCRYGVGASNGTVYSTTQRTVLPFAYAVAAASPRELIGVKCVVPGTTEMLWVSRLLDQSAGPMTECEAPVARQPHGRFVTAELTSAQNPLPPEVPRQILQPGGRVAATIICSLSFSRRACAADWTVLPDESPVSGRT